ncbi:WecB/TagA/CpsF family glycosyltransferase [Bradyrhizobium sp. MOS003]|uniref:WecB/TagA/CpsF family glycosyltransferase n=1 Tax=Bradyrhizobium sp. MOS003 TaxID=2133946 RepID=UPI000D12E851|nr:WecB/TagA/CpsF family glycosyltransferase [Bradyrhizobium sp. MOS003]PSO16471.1 glycosyltransferase [Bradyrhizobium sp. MOS003]
MSTHSTLREMRRLVERVDVIETREQEDHLIESLLEIKAPTIVSFLNQHAFNLAFVEPTFRLALQQSSLLLRDGVGVECCMLLLGQRPGRNLNGTDLIPRILEAAKGKRVALFGTSPEWLRQAQIPLKDRGTQVVVALDGFQTHSDYLNAVRTIDPDIVVLGMGMPRQELLAAEIANASDRARLIFNGGAILDFFAGRFPRAPEVIRAARLEWMFRLGQEPRRLAHRYLLGGMKFAWRIYQLKRVLGSNNEGLV